MKIISDHGFPKGDGSHPDDDPFDRFKNERDYVAQSGHSKTTVAAMDWAAAEIERLRTLSWKYLQEIGVQAQLCGAPAQAGKVPALVGLLKEIDPVLADALSDNAAYVGVIRSNVINECVCHLENSYPDHAWLNAACAALRSLAMTSTQHSPTGD